MNEEAQTNSRLNRALTTTLLILFIATAAAFVYFSWDKTFREATVLLAGTLVATQFATTGARRMISRLRESGDCGGVPKMKTTVKNRCKSIEEEPEGGALESWSNQIVATWGLAFLIFGQSVMLFVRFLDTGRPLHIVAAFTSLMTAVPLFLYATLLRKKPASLVPYYRNELARADSSWLDNLMRIIPPSDSGITWVRVALFYIYASLLLISWR